MFVLAVFLFASSMYGSILASRKRFPRVPRPLLAGFSSTISRKKMARHAPLRGLVFLVFASRDHRYPVCLFGLCWSNQATGLPGTPRLALSSLIERGRTCRVCGDLEEGQAVISSEDQRAKDARSSCSAQLVSSSCRYKRVGKCWAHPVAQEHNQPKRPGTIQNLLVRSFQLL